MSSVPFVSGIGFDTSAISFPPRRKHLQLKNKIASFLDIFSSKKTSIFSQARKLPSFHVSFGFHVFRQTLNQPSNGKRK
jgi:hypothetical protein